MISRSNSAAPARIVSIRRLEGLEASVSIAWLLDLFREQGRKGGKRSLETMTPDQHRARAKKAVAAREARRNATKKKELYNYARTNAT
jgi:hypothetical protein